MVMKKMVNGWGLTLLMGILLVNGFALANDSEKSNKPVRVLAVNYRGVVYNSDWLNLSRSVYNFARRHSDDKRNLFLSGCIGLTVAYEKNWWPSVQDIIDGVEKDKESYKIEGVTKYRDELYDSLQGDLEYVDPKMEELLKRVKENGVHLVLASNMHPDQYQENVDRLKPDLFGLFEIHHIGDHENGRKPTKLFFDRLRKKMDKELCNDNQECVKSMEIVNVDRKQDHIDGAQDAQVGFTNYRFAGDIEEFENELCAHGFLSEEECRK